jgi:hypothetical protein
MDELPIELFMNECPIEIFIYKEDPEKVHARSNYRVGSGKTVDEAIASLRSLISPEADKGRMDRAEELRKKMVPHK